MRTQGRRRAVDAGGDACTGTETRYSGLAYQACEEGSFVNVESCGFACDAAAGCTDCDPGSGDTCDGDDVVTCDADGSFGQAWAFAQWGGRCYLFVTTSEGGISNSTVRTIDRTTGDAVTLLQNLPSIIVGAGVSTCAPTEIE